MTKVEEENKDQDDNKDDIKTVIEIYEKLTPKYDRKLFVAFDDPVPVDKEHRLKEKETHLKYAYSSVNMERLIDNKEDVPWGNIPIVNTNLAPLGSKPPGNGGNDDRREEDPANGS